MAEEDDDGEMTRMKVLHDIFCKVDGLDEKHLTLLKGYVIARLDKIRGRGDGGV